VANHFHALYLDTYHIYQNWVSRCAYDRMRCQAADSRPQRSRFRRGFYQETPAVVSGLVDDNRAIQGLWLSALTALVSGRNPTPTRAASRRASSSCCAVQPAISHACLIFRPPRYTRPGVVLCDVHAVHDTTATIRSPLDSLTPCHRLCPLMRL
jgi:hypothetical protein